jgi:hypothetical protein
MVSLHDHHIREFAVDVIGKRLRLVTELAAQSCRDSTSWRATAIHAVKRMTSRFLLRPEFGIGS